MKVARLVGAFVLALAFAIPVHAQDRGYNRSPDNGRDQGQRRVWVYDVNGGGAFRDMGNGRWVEETRKGKITFKEVKRTPEYIELIDPSRNHGVLLYDSVSYHLPPEFEEWSHLSEGRWR